jgi:hypothetical protein
MSDSDFDPDVLRSLRAGRAALCRWPAFSEFGGSTARSSDTMPQTADAPVTRTRLTCKTKEKRAVSESPRVANRGPGVSEPSGPKLAASAGALPPEAFRTPARRPTPAASAGKQLSMRRPAVALSEHGQQSPTVANEAQRALSRPESESPRVAKRGRGVSEPSSPKPAASAGEQPVVRRPAADLSKTSRCRLRKHLTEHPALRRTGPKLTPFARLSASGKKHRLRQQKAVKAIIIGAGWGRTGTTSFATNCQLQGFDVTHEVGVGCFCLRGGY